MNKIDHILKTLQYSKSDIQPDLKDMLPVYEKIIILYLGFCKKCIEPLLPYLPQQEQPQGPQLKLLDGSTDNQMNMQSSETSVQPPNNLPCLAAWEVSKTEQPIQHIIKNVLTIYLTVPFKCWFILANLVDKFGKWLLFPE